MSFLTGFSIPNCRTNNFFAANELAVELGEKFCKCSAARKILQNLPSNGFTFLEVGDFIHSHSNQNRIYIPNKEVKNGKALSSLAIGIFNVEKSKEFDELLDHSAEGAIGMNELAIQMERIEHQSQISQNSLMEKCSEVWNIDSETATLYSTAAQLTHEESLWMQEVECHTDKIRERWIDSIQKEYCQIRPEDLESCMATKDQLCDLYQVVQMPQNEKMSFFSDRACKRITEASENIKELYQPVLKDVCPEFYEKEDDYTYLLVGLAAVTVVAVASVAAYYWIKKRNTKIEEKKL